MPHLCRMASLTMLSLAVACSTAATPPGPRMKAYDDNTQYRVEDTRRGFKLTIRYSEYQFRPDERAVGFVCIQTLVSLAHEIADERGLTIEQIDRERVRLTFGRNGLTGRTTCSGSVSVVAAGSAASPDTAGFAGRAPAFTVMAVYL